MVLNKSLQVKHHAQAYLFRSPYNLQEINVQNMNVELVAQMFKNYQSNVLFHLEGTIRYYMHGRLVSDFAASDGQLERSFLASPLENNEDMKF